MSDLPTPPIDPMLAMFDQLGISSWSAGRVCAGLNAFVAMCNTLCILEGPEARIYDPKAKHFLSTGVNLLGIDPATNLLIQDLVLGPVRHLQNKWLRRVNPITALEKRYSSIRQSRGVDGASSFETAKRNADQPLHLLDVPGYEDPGDLFEERQHIRKELAYTSPRFIASSVYTKELARELSESHLGHMLVAPQFSWLKDVENLDVLLNAVMSGSFIGRSSKDAFSTTTGGHVIATASLPIANVLSHPSLCAATWPTRIIALPTKLIGESISSQHPSASKPFHTLANYGKALEQVLHRRLKMGNEPPPHVEGVHASYRQVIRKISLIPDIDPSLAEHAAPLFATLLRGMMLMVDASCVSWPSHITVEGLKELSLLVIRSASRQLARERQSVLVSMKREEALRIYDKLTETPSSIREITRGFHRLNRTRCLEALEWLRSMDLVTSEGVLWRTSDGLKGDPRRLIQTSDLIIDVSPP